MIQKFSLTLTILIFLTHSSALASDLKPMLQLGYDFGGTTLATIERYDYYNGYETNSLRAGQGLSFEVGAAIENPNDDLELQFLVGYKFDQESAYNGSVTWEQIPFSALAMLNQNNWKLGGGVTYHLNPKLTGSFTGYDNNNLYFNDSVNDKYENSIGGIVQIQYKFSEASALGIKGTFIEYKLKNDPSVTANGNSVGINFNYKFGEHSEFR